MPPAPFARPACSLFNFLKGSAIGMAIRFDRVAAFAAPVQINRGNGARVASIAPRHDHDGDGRRHHHRNGRGFGYYDDGYYYDGYYDGYAYADDDDDVVCYYSRRYQRRICHPA